MKIVTVNVEESTLEVINKLIGENGLYPSRSELIRVAVREFLLKELKAADNLTRFNKGELDDFDEEDFVKVPVEHLDENEESVREFKTYKIIKRLQYNETQEPTEINDVKITMEEYDYGDEEFPNFEEIERRKPTLNQLRETFPDLSDYKFINEG